MKHRMRWLLVAVLLCGLFQACSLLRASGEKPTADFFVATNGKDSWSGRLPAPNAARNDGPFASIARARDAIRDLKKRQGGLKGDVTALIRGGIYRLDEPIAFNAEDSGTEQYSITYAAYPGEKPTLSGGRVIGPWRRSAGNLWTTEIPDVKSGRWHFRQIFVGGQRRVRARAPQEGFYRIVRYEKDDRMQFTFRAGDFKNWNNLADVEMVTFYDWEIARAHIASVDEKTSTVRFQYPVGRSPHYFGRFDPHQRYYVENALELLDAPGEWHLDRHTGTLTYWPMKGERLGRVEVVAPRLEKLLVVSGALEQPMRNLHFRGLTFCHTEFPLPPQGYNGIQACFHSSDARPWRRMPSAVEFKWAVGCSFRGNRIAHVGGSGLDFEMGCRNNQIVGNEIADTAGNGIVLGEARGKPDNPSEVSRDNLIANNYIHHCGVDYPGAVGIWIGHTERSRVSHNELCDLPYTGISLGWTWNPTPTVCRENILEHNHIHRVVKQLADAGGIYTLGFQPGTIIRGNLIHGVDKRHGRAPSNGIFFDEGSKEFLVEGNIIYDAPDGVIRFNQCKKEWHTFKDNAFDVRPDAPGFPQEAAARAGLEEPYRGLLVSK
ncbi:right-handed parallel beta-helix repeat-containing protein [Candidatus Sumerlaeota bacterium]|nr:right-handed parallel beta-helix repeat-containing protein [Candidatus Sumerlaeota bacterium]